MNTKIMTTKIVSIHGREILDSRGNPTVEVDVLLEDGTLGRASVPSGVSTGTREAVELRDKDEHRYHGMGVKLAVANVNGTIASAICGMDSVEQSQIDRLLCELDGTPNKSNLGANAILGVSLAIARATAESKGIPLYRYLSADKPWIMPVPFFNILNGGMHSDNNLDIQEYMIAPVGAASFSEALRMGSEIYHSLKTLLKKNGLSTSIGDEGGFAPQLKSDVEAIELIMSAIKQSGYRAGSDVILAIDTAANSFYEDGTYVFRKSDQSRKSAEEMITMYADWTHRYPLESIEDGLAEQDWAGWKILTQRLGKGVQLIGDDIFVTNPKILRQGIEKNIANAVLIKVNQIGTLTETMATIKEAVSNGYHCMISHRSGETTDNFISHLAVASGVGQIKSGAPCRSERLEKYNELYRIEEELGEKASYAGLQWRTNQRKISKLELRASEDLVLGNRMFDQKKPLFILPFDHRHSFEKDLFDIRRRPPTAQECSEISAYKTIIYEGFKEAIAEGVPKGSAGILVDEQFGSSILSDAKSHGYIVACSVEKSGQEEFEFEYGDNFENHILSTKPDYVKVLIRYNPEGDIPMNERQVARLQKLSNFCLKNNFNLMVELLVPPSFAQSLKVTGDLEIYHSEIRPKVIVAAIKELQSKGIEAKIWKLEGVSNLSDCALISKQARSNGREFVGLIVLGGGEDIESMKQWLTTAAMTDGYIGFAIGRTVWEKALKKVKKKQISPQEACNEIAVNFKVFCDLWSKVSFTKNNSLKNKSA
jgi:enolase